MLGKIGGLLDGLTPLGGALKLAPWIGCALLAVALMGTRATLHSVRQAHQIIEEGRRADIAEQDAMWMANFASATSAYAAREADRTPLIIRSTETVTKYAQTDAGRNRCLDPDRVRGIEDLDRALDRSAATGDGAGTVPHPAADPQR